ncbi:hypothetical protein PYW07_008372 [Mythimna separata]|uniref:Luciferin 4-monooxygenase n=1 Tax=Mythimna separata TaxID=271217 RepID=A0AAD7YCK8_MYTSE|nr:hypothetical protein PYW07_008372 [Mythimna separata]
MKLAPFDVTNENYNLGHLCMDALRIRPDAVCVIDAATGESETNASVLARSIQLAKCFRKLGAKPGDVLALGGRNHLDLQIPYHAAIMNGMPIAGVDPLFKHTEIKKMFEICSPRVAFCQKELLDTYHAVKEELGLNTEIICFDEGKNSLASFIDKYDDKEDKEEFLPVIVDRKKHYAWLVCTGGTTGVVKLAAFTHASFLKKLEMLKVIMSSVKQQEPSEEQKLALNTSPVQWLSSVITTLVAPLLRETKLQTSKSLTIEHMVEMINKYKPVNAFLSPPIATALIKSEKKCDFTCFERIMLSGGKIHKDILLELRKRVRPGTPVVELYAQTENLGPVFMGTPEGPLGTCGKPIPAFPVKIVDPETGKEITEPNVPGEVWTKGASFSEYYNNPEETAASFTEDGWFKTGDILYRDEEGYFFFVERLKMLIKYRMYHVIAPEIEAVIREHPGVLDVSVTSVPHDEDGEHPVACVMRSPGSKVTAEEIKEMVANKLSDSQRLRGGVIFMDKLPMTSTGKIARGELRKLVLTLHRE